MQPCLAYESKDDVFAVYAQIKQLLGPPAEGKVLLIAHLKPQIDLIGPPLESPRHGHNGHVR